jgi:hypothetical protein
VATKVGNVAEMLDYDERFLSPSKDPDTLARGVLYIYHHQDIVQEIIKGNQVKVREIYDKRIPS